MKVWILAAARRALMRSSGTITEITEARAEVRVRVDGAAEAAGRGAIYLSDLWAWPDAERTHEERDAALRVLCERIAAGLPALCGNEPLHPLALGLRLHESTAALDDRAAAPPLLARLVCASPFDAAIHDAAGIALGRCAFDLYDAPAPVPGADAFFGEEGACCAAIARTLQAPRDRLDAWLVVGTGDSLDDMTPWVRERGYHCFKLKISGRDNAADVARTVAVFRAARELGVCAPRLSVDSNCANPDAQSVLDYLQRLRQADAAVYDALEFIEQPTGRDIRVHRHDWRAVSRHKPVLLDEGLTGMQEVVEAMEQGWSGLALKTCKGHSLSLAAAAWGHRHGMALAMQDLTNPGLAAIHSALFAARLPSSYGIELNSPQYTPAANSEWLPRLAGLFEPTDGAHHLPEPGPYGLGSRL